MDSGIDFGYFSSAPMPYPFFESSGQNVNNNHQYNEFRNSQAPEHFDPAFAAFQQNFQYDPSTFVAQSQSQVPASVPPATQARHASISQSEHAFENIQPQPPEVGNDESLLPMGRSSSEEKDNLTPQQNKRKAQNRAAQRAFRERKEKHVKDLEARNTNLQQKSMTLETEVERLRRELAKVATENEILRATSGGSSNASPFVTEPDELVGPLEYTPTDYTSKIHPLNDDSAEWNPNAKWAQFGAIETIAVDNDSGEPLLTAGATWDYIQAHELYRKGLVDVGDVCERLKKMARCDGQGPVFQESDIRRAISESAVAGGRDELI